MKEQVNDLSGVKVGDKLYSIMFGYGEVVEIDILHTHRFCVEFDSGDEAFTSGGKWNVGDEYPTLFWDKPVFEYPKKPKTVTISERAVDDAFLSESCTLHEGGLADKIKKKLGF